MTKAELIDAIAGAKGADGVSKKAILAIVDEAFGQINKELKKSGRFSVPGFGTFNKKMRKARTGRNPQTGATIKIKAQKTVGFRPAQSLKDSMNK